MDRISEGEKYKCIKTVIMDDGEVAYIKGRTYISECNGCITDVQGVKEHYWMEEIDKDCWINFFERLK